MTVVDAEERSATRSFQAGTSIETASFFSRYGAPGLSHPLLKFSGGSGDDYATIPDDSSSLSVSNSLSGRHWELDQVPAVGDPTDIVQFGTGHHVSANEGRRRVALQRRVAAYLVVVDLEVAKFSFKITGIPEQHLVEIFSPRRSDQALHEWVGPGHGVVARIVTGPHDAHRQDSYLPMRYDTGRPRAVI